MNSNDLSSTETSHVQKHFAVLAILVAVSTCFAFQGGALEPRARDLGIPFDGTPGALNAITDVAGVEVGHETLIIGKGKLEVGVGPVRTGVTTILPRGKGNSGPVYAGWFSLNGNGEMTGTTWIEQVREILRKHNRLVESKVTK